MVQIVGSLDMSWRSGQQSQGGIGEYLSITVRVLVWRGGASLWGELEVPSELMDRPWLNERGVAPGITVTAELEREGHALYELDPVQDDSPPKLAQRVAELSRRCSKSKRRNSDCSPLMAESRLQSLSNKIGEKSCQHPEAKEARALFCRYPPRFYGHSGICNQYSQFCPFEELLTETDPTLIDTAVVNVDADMFYSMEETWPD